MKLTKNIITRDEAVKLAPDYVAFVEGNWDKFDGVLTALDSAHKGQLAVTAHPDGDKFVFVRVRISSIDRNSIRAVDGPVIRVSNDEYSWRVDGDKYAFPLTAQP
jgi:hypothetical protein